MSVSVKSLQVLFLFGVRACSKFTVYSALALGEEARGRESERERVREREEKKEERHKRTTESDVKRTSESVVAGK